MLTEISIQELVRNGVPVRPRDEEAYRRMAPGLRRLARRIAKYLEGGGGSLPAFCRAGAECLKLMMDDDFHGDNAHADLAVYLGVTELALMAARDIAVSVSSSELEALTSRRTPQSGNLTLAHLAILAHVELARDRYELAERTLAVETSPESLCEWASRVPGDHFMQRTFCRQLNPAFKEDEAASTTVSGGPAGLRGVDAKDFPPSDHPRLENA